MPSRFRFRKFALLLALTTLFALLAIAIFAQPPQPATNVHVNASLATATNPIDAARRMDWSKAGAGVIPTNRTQCGATIAPYGTLGTPASASTINTAINACGPGTYVLLGNGSFFLNTTVHITVNNVTLRGGGPNQTKLFFFGEDATCLQPADICAEGSGNWDGHVENSTTWTAASYAVGQTQVTVPGAGPHPAVGQLVILDQANDLLDTNQVFVSSSTIADGSHTGASTDTTDNCGFPVGSNNGGPGRNVSNVCYNQQQYVIVTGVSGNVITFTPGLYMPNWASAKNPGMWWANTVTTGVGIENLSVDNTNSTGEIYGIFFDNTIRGWIKDVRSITIVGGSAGGRGHVGIQYAAQLTIRDSYFYGTIAAAAESYGIEHFQAGDVLVENNSFQHLTTPTISSCAGCVISYNYSIDDFNGLNTMFPSHYSHDVGADMALWEGNSGLGWIQDPIHGSHNFGTAYRNYFIGREGTKTSQTVPILLYAHSRYANVVGNVLGLSGYHTQYQTNTGDSITNCDVSIYNFGYVDTDCQSLDANTPHVVSTDTLVATTLMRWGNYDVVNVAVQWNNAEVPSGISPFPNPIPSSHAMPNSQYLSAKPSWWPASPPYPPIGPDVTGGDVSGVGGFVYKIPAQKCFESLSDDPAYAAGTVKTYAVGAGLCPW